MAMNFLARIFDRTGRQLERDHAEARRDQAEATGRYIRARARFTMTKGERDLASWNAARVWLEVCDRRCAAFGLPADHAEHERLMELRGAR
jgi:hypothetical protein